MHVDLQLYYFTFLILFHSSHAISLFLHYFIFSALFELLKLVISSYPEYSLYLDTLWFH